MSFRIFRLLLSVIFVLTACAACCRIGHYAWVRVSVKDVETRETITNADCTVYCNFPHYGFWGGRRPDTVESLRVKPEDGGVKWFWGPTDASYVFAWLYEPPVGYYKTHVDREEGCARFSLLASFVPVPLHFPPVRSATVYARRQTAPINADVFSVRDLHGPYTNGVRLGKFYPNRINAPVLTRSYAFTAEYDCLKGDYLPPYGTGVVADVEIRHAYDFLGYKTENGQPSADWIRSRTIKFPGKGNGFVAIPPYDHVAHEYAAADFQAPTDGYIPEDVSSFTPDGNIGATHAECFFRIRSEYAEDGTMTRCHYGFWRGTYSYYLGMRGEFFVNPEPLDRNLEMLNGIRRYEPDRWKW